MLRRYSRASAQAFGPARNPHSYIFYDYVGTAGDVKAVQEDALSKRLGRLLKTLTGRAPRSQLFRPIFVTWFGMQRPTMEERDYFTEWMMHSLEMQLSAYDKRLLAGEVEVGAKRQRTLLRDED